MSAIQKGEKVLITGATGWVGSHVVHEALAAGLYAKIAIRDEQKARTLIDALEKIHGKTHIETVLVKDFTDDAAFYEAVKGVQAVVHVASDVSFSDDKDNVVGPVVRSYENLLNASAQQKDIRRFVLTSSSVAVGFPNPNGKTTQKWGTENWNDAAVEAIKGDKPNGFETYAGSKVLSERAAWNFQKEKKPQFSITTVNPNCVFGAPIPGTMPRSTGGMLVDAAQGKDSGLEMLGAQYHIDVDDTAKLHIIALMREDVKNERILAFGDKMNMNIIIDTIKKFAPAAPTKEQKPEWNEIDNTEIDTSRAKELLKDFGGIKSLEYSIRGNLQVPVENVVPLQA